jgi:transposase, IS30 family
MGRCYPHLNLEERRNLAKWLEAKIPVAEIAQNLSRAPCTIYREIKRNSHRDNELPQLDGYHAIAAQAMYERRRAIHRKLVVHAALKAAVEDRLKSGWSPEQIAGRMKVEQHPIRVSHETIYRYAYSRDGRAEAFYRHLPEHRSTTFDVESFASPLAMPDYGPNGCAITRTTAVVKNRTGHMRSRCFPL